MYSHRDPQARVDVVDLDPYGTAAPFIDGAIQSVRDGGGSVSSRHGFKAYNHSQGLFASLAQIWRFWQGSTIPRNGMSRPFLERLSLTSFIVLPTMEAYRSRESTVTSRYVRAPFQYQLLILSQALRLVLHAIATSGARYGRFITPLMSLSIDFYVRLFVRVNTGALEVKRLARYVYLYGLLNTS